MERGQLDGLAGTTLAGKYRLTALLGSGGMGVVYQAEQLELGRSVAIKLLRRDPSTSLGTGLPRSSFERFRTEALAASRINHPHAVAIYDFGQTDDDVPFIVMEHLRGATLASLLETELLPAERIIGIATQILSALDEAHACGVVHCDLTSDNVIVERMRDGNDFAKVIDFGLARAFETDAGSTRIIGTPEYMAPEQIRGDPIVPQTDLYAVGNLMYEMIVGRTPFAGAAVPVVLDGHLHASPTAPADIVAACPRRLSDIVEWALAKSPADRPTTAKQLRDELLAVTNGGRQVARPPNLARGSRTIRRTTRPAGPPRPRRATRLSGDFGRTAMLIGRDRELDAIAGFIRGGGGSSLAITGAPGIGKARLVVEALDRSPDVAAYVAAPDPSGLRSPWYPILSVLETVLGIERAPDVETLSQAVARCGLPDRDVPGLSELFGIEGPGRDLELAVRRREAHAAAVRTLLSAQRRSPRSVIAFIDVDEFDEPSRKAVRALTEALATTTGVRVIVTAPTPDDAPATTSAMAIAPLSPTSTRELTESLTGADLPLPTADVLHDLTAGSPGAIEHVAGWLLTGNNAATAPSLLVDLVSIRVNRLDAGARCILQAVAVHGTAAPRWLVVATAGDGPLPPLDDATWTGLLADDGDELAIPSELVANVVMACTPADVKRTLHARALQALDGRAPAGVLGHHAEHAGHLEHAHTFFAAAANDAIARFDDSSARRYYQRATGIARRLLDRGARGAPAMFVHDAVQLAGLLRLSGDLGMASALLRDAEQLCNNDGERAALDGSRGKLAITAGNGAEAIDCLRRAIGSALKAGDRDFLCTAYLDLVAAMDREGQSSSATAELAEAIDVITMGEGLRSNGAPPRLWFLGMRLAERQLRAKDPPAACKTALDALEQARRIGSARGRGRLSTLLARIYESMGQTSAALRHRAHAIDLMNRLGDRRSTAELLLDDIRATRSRSGDDSGSYSSVSPERGLRLAKRLASEIGWNEGIALSKKAETDADNT